MGLVNYWKKRGQVPGYLFLFMFYCILATIPVGRILSKGRIKFQGKTGTVGVLAFFSISRAMMAAPFSVGITKGRRGNISFNGVAMKPGCKTVMSMFLR